MRSYYITLVVILLSDALQYIQEDSGVLPRAAVISVSGLGGIVAGYRGNEDQL